MTADDRFKVFGVYLSESVANELSAHLYREAGVVDLESYFDETADAVPVGDPGAEATDELVATVVENFASLYDDADFEAAAELPHDGFVLVRLAAEPTRVSALRERFRAAETIREVDLRTVQTAILAAALETDVDAES